MTSSDQSIATYRLAVSGWCRLAVVGGRGRRLALNGAALYVPVVGAVIICNSREAGHSQERGRTGSGALPGQ